MRKVVVAVVTCALALTAILILLLATLDIGRYRGLIEVQASQAVGREVRLAGPMRLGLALHPTLVAEQVSVANPSWASRPQLATFERIEVTIGLLPLLARRVEIDRLAIDGADVGLERAADGRGNWLLLAATPHPAVAGDPEVAGEPAIHLAAASGRPTIEAPSSAGGQAPLVRELRIRDSRITFRDVSRAIDHELQLSHASLAADDTTTPLGLDVAGELDGQPVSLRGEVGAIASLLAATGPFPIDLTGRALGMELQLAGSAGLRPGDALDLRLAGGAADVDALRLAIGPYLPHGELLEGAGPLSIEGRLVGTPDRPAVEALVLSGQLVGIELRVTGAVGDLAAMRGVDLTVTAQGEPAGLRALLPTLPAGEVKGSARITGSAASLVVDPLDFAQGGSDVAGRLSLELDGARPRIGAVLTSQRLSLPAGIGLPSQAAELREDGRQPLFPDVPLDLEPVRAVDADLALDVARLVIGGQEVRHLRLRATLVAGAVSVDKLSGAFAGSPFEGSGRLDASAAVPTADFRLDSPALDLGTLLGALEITDLVRAKGRLRIAVQARGATPHALAQSLAGRADAVFVNGRINAEAVRQPMIGVQRFFGSVLSPLRGEWVALDCIAAGFGVEQGVARPDVLLIDNAISRAVGTGKIDIGGERWALTVTPSAKGIGLDLGLPIRISGPLGAPEIGLDEKGAVADVGALVGKLLFPPALIAGMIDFAGNDSPCVRSVQAGPGTGWAPGRVEDAAGEVLKGLGRGLQELLPR